MRSISKISENSYRAFLVAIGAAGQYPPIYKQDLSTPDGRRSRPVSHDEFQQLASQGHALHKALSSPAYQQPTNGIDDNWDATVKHAYEATRQPWGGATYHPSTGKALEGNEDLYAITARDPGKQTLEVDPNANYQDFHAAMTNARQQFGPELSRHNHHLGVFHDDDVKKIQFDPAYVTPKHSDVETFGAYTRNVGGAYHFKSGDGYWPPHVAEPGAQNPAVR